MKHLLLLATCLWILTLNGIAQELEDLNRSLNNAKNKTEKFHALVNLSDYWSYRDSTKALQILHQAKPLIDDQDNLQGIYLFYEAGVYYDFDPKKSQKLYMEAEDYFKKLNSTEAFRYRARLWHNFAALEQLSDNDKAFLDITLKHCIPYAIKSGDDDLLMGYFTDVGMVFFNHKEYDKALEYYEKAVSMVRKPEHETQNLLWAYLNMFDVYYYQGNKEKSQRILEKAETLLKKLPEKKLAGVFYKNKAKLQSLSGNYSGALSSIEEGLKVAKEYNFQYDFTTLNYEKAQIYKNAKDWPAAKIALEELLKNNYGGTSKNRLALIYELSDVEANLGNYKNAYELTHTLKLLNDSLNNLGFKNQIAELEAKYKIKEKEQAIQNLENRNLINRGFIIGGILLALILSLWALYAWNMRKKRNEKDLQLVLQQREIDISKALINGEEHERKRLSRDLHDGLIGQVTGLKMNMERIVRDGKHQELTGIIHEMSDVITELRHTAQNLEPSTLKNHGLEEAITQYAKSFETDSTNISIYTHGLNAITDKHIQLSIFRIVQELINNAVKHAEASQILFQGTFENNLLLIEVEDNGKGFIPETAARNMGLNNLESRTKAIGGSIHIDSEPGKGTHISIECQFK